MVGPCCKASAGRVETTRVRWTRDNLINQDLGPNRWCCGNLRARFVFIIANTRRALGDVCCWCKVAQAEIGYLLTRRASFGWRLLWTLTVFVPRAFKLAWSDGHE